VLLDFEVCDLFFGARTDRYLITFHLLFHFDP